MSNLFYTGSKWKLGNQHYPLYICKGIRSRGKTTHWLKELVEWAMKDLEHNKFIYLRRTNVQLGLAIDKGLFACVRNAFSEWGEQFPSECYERGKIYLINTNGEKIHIGYYFDLNNVKGISIEDANVLLFDEYVEPKRSAYKGGEQGAHEPELFLRLLETIFRKRNFWVVLLGNQDYNSNPYEEYFRIPYNVPSFRRKDGNLPPIWYEYDTSEETIKNKSNTTIGRLSAGTSYGNYTVGLSSMSDVSPDLICKVAKNCQQYCNVKIFGSLLTMWVDDNGIEYITDDRAINEQYPIMCVTTQDMTIDTNFVAYNTDFLMIQKLLYSKGKIRFSSQNVASLFYVIMKLQ